MLISGIYVDFDIATYAHKRLHRVRPTSDYVIACCPFHDDRNPSFSVNSATGRFKCFGCGARGTFGTLYQRLEGFDTLSEAEGHLIAAFGRFEQTSTDTLEIVLDEPTPQNVDHDYYIDESVLTPYRFRHPYLTNRGISEDTQRRFGIGYCKRSKAVTLPWRDANGRLITVKKRSVLDKRFWYEPALPPGVNRKTWYGLYAVGSAPLVAITEAEIDALYVWDASIASISIGGNQPTKEQFNVLIRELSPDTELLVFTDNDAGGEHAKHRISDELSGRFRLSHVDWSLVDGSVKDANDLAPDDVRRLVERRNGLGLALSF